MNEQVIAQLQDEIKRREKGRVALLKALVEIHQSKSHKQAVERAEKQLIAAGATIPPKKTVTVPESTTQ